jgi:hypothetical protein
MELGEVNSRLEKIRDIRIWSENERCDVRGSKPLSPTSCGEDERWLVNTARTPQDVVGGILFSVGVVHNVISVCCYMNVI